MAARRPTGCAGCKRIAVFWMRSLRRLVISKTSLVPTIARVSPIIWTTCARSSAAFNARKNRPPSNPNTPSAPVGIPESYEEHVKLMFDLQALAFQADITRVATFMMARELSQRTYPQVNAPDPHHATSHHQNDAKKIEALTRIQTYHIALFGHYLSKLRSIPDGDGTLLDHTMLLYGSNMSNSNLHNHFPLPVLVAGGACGKIKGGRHLRYADEDPDDESARHYAGQARACPKIMLAIAPASWWICKSMRAKPLYLALALAAAALAGNSPDTRLVDAAAKPDLETVRKLVAEHIDVNIPQADGTTALHWAAHWDDSEMAELLISAGANPKTTNAYGGTPLSEACTNADAAMIVKLLKAGADPNARSSEGETALMTAARTGSVESVKALLDHGAEVNARGTMAGANGVDVGRGRESSGRGGTAHRAWRGRKRALRN